MRWARECVALNADHQEDSHEQIHPSINCIDSGCCSCFSQRDLVGNLNKIHTLSGVHQRALLCQQHPWPRRDSQQLNLWQWQAPAFASSSSPRAAGTVESQCHLTLLSQFQCSFNKCDSLLFTLSTEFSNFFLNRQFAQSLSWLAPPKAGLALAREYGKPPAIVRQRSGTRVKRSKRCQSSQGESPRRECFATPYVWFYGHVCLVQLCCCGEILTRPYRSPRWGAISRRVKTLHGAAAHRRIRRREN